MKILFLTLLDFNSIDEYNIYTDLLREFAKHRHEVYAISPVEKKKKQATHLINTEKATILKLKIGNTQKTNIIEKGISTLRIENQFINGIKKYFPNVKFDLVLYSTPPITFCNVIEYVKKRDEAKSYLMLKDIFPQNAVDIGILRKSGVKGIIYKYFRNKEKKLYEISDKIGCMSEGNVDYILKNNPDINSQKVEICPNCIEVIDKSINEEIKKNIRNKYSIPMGKTVFIYGGNLGKPQGIDFLIECLKSQKQNDKVFFLIVGDGTEYRKLESYITSDKPANVRLMKRLPKQDYDTVVAACDVGLVFLDYRFTIPNFPSRILSYMEVGIPILAATDSNTDLKEIIQNNKFGFWCKNGDLNSFLECLTILKDSEVRKCMGENAREFLEKNYTSEKCYTIITKHYIK